MRIEDVMNTSDGLGADPGDPIAQIAADCGYSATDDETGSIETLIDYKNALEDRLRGALNTLASIAAGVPVEDEWDSAADFMEAVAVELDRGEFKRPEHYTE